MHRLVARRGALMVPLLLASCTDRQVSPDQGPPADLRLELGAADGSTEQGCIKPPEASIGDAMSDHPNDAPERDGPADQGPAGDGPVDGDLPDGSSPCPPCMVLVGGSYCIDIYEASRPDATSSSQGTKADRAECQAGVIPWYSYALSPAVAKQACAAAGKRLCSPAEWQLACSGPQATVYAYGNSYSPTVCNGIDTFCYCGTGQACAGVSPCPYPHCFNQPPPSGAPPAACGAAFHVLPTGSFSGCVNPDGVHDLNGNVWELVDTSDGLNHFRGGAYNCGDSETLHRCDYDATWSPSAQGFRCCADPLPSG